MSSQDPVRFGPYLLDRRTGELRKHGLRVKLAGQPLEVLLFLLERRGELVTREELRQRLWADDVFVDFERSLNSAVKKLRRALNEDPQQPRYIETYPRKGYRFIGALEPDVAASSAIAVSLPTEVEPAAALPGETRQPGSSSASAAPSSHRWKWLFVVLLVAALALIISLKVGRGGKGLTSVAGSAVKKVNARSSIAVLGFKNLSSHREDEWLSAAIAQMLSTELANGDKARMIPDEIVARAKSDLNLKERDSYARDTLRDLRTRLNADYVVAGSYMAVGDKNTGQVRLDLRLQETISGETLTSIAVSGKQVDILQLVAQAGKEMRAKLGSSVPPEGDVDWRSVLPSSTEAAKLYSEGLAHLRVSDSVSASDLLQRSVAIEPDFALGHAALADAWATNGYDARALASAQKALSLSNGLPEDERLEIQGRYYELHHDWIGAISAYRHLVQDFPDDLESGLKLAAAATAAGNLNDARAVLSNLRSLPAPAKDDPRIDLAEAAAAAKSGDYRQQQALAERAAKKAESSGARLLLARAKLVQGWALDDQSRLKEAGAAYSTAQKIFEQTGSEDGTATALNDLGIVLQKQGDLAGAIAKLEDARRAFLQIGDENKLAGTLTNLGEVYRARGDLAKAEGLYREALQIFRKTGRKDNEYATVNNLGGVLYQRGDFREARKLFESLADMRQAEGDMIGVALAKTNLADPLRVLGQLGEATTLHQQALEIFKEAGDRATAAAVELSLAKVLIVKRDFSGARRSLHEALVTNEAIGAKGDAAVARVMLARVGFLEHHPEQFDSSVQSAIEELKSEDRRADEAEARAMQAEALLANGQMNEARNALQIARALHTTDWLVQYRLDFAAAQLDAAQGNTSAAIEKLNTILASSKQTGCVICQNEIQMALEQKRK